MNEQHSFQLGLKLRLKALCFCLKDLWNTSPDCFIPFLLYVFVVRHGPSWRWTQILKQKFARRIPYVGNCTEISQSFLLHSLALTAKKTFQNWALEDYLETKITCAKSIARWFKDIQFVTFLSPSWRSLDLFLGGVTNHHPKKGHDRRIARWLFLQFPLLQRCFRYLFLDMIHLSFIQFPSCRCAKIYLAAIETPKETPKILERFGAP